MTDLTPSPSLKTMEHKVFGSSKETDLRWAKAYNLLLEFHPDSVRGSPILEVLEKLEKIFDDPSHLEVVEQDFKEKTLKLRVGGVYKNFQNQIVTIVRKSTNTLKNEHFYIGNNDCEYNERGDVEFPSSGEKHWLSKYRLVAEKIDTTSPKKAFDNLRLWGEQIFGQVVPSRIVERAQEEMDELKEKVLAGWTPEAVEEAADVVIILTRAPGLWEAIERKMSINYARKWNLKGDGTGYHIPDQPKAEPSLEKEDEDRLTLKAKTLARQSYERQNCVEIKDSIPQREAYVNTRWRDFVWEASEDLLRENTTA